MAWERQVTITFVVDPCDLSDDEVHEMTERLVSQMEPEPNVLTYEQTQVRRVQVPD